MERQDLFLMNTYVAEHTIRSSSLTQAWLLRLNALLPTLRMGEIFKVTVVQRSVSFEFEGWVQVNRCSLVATSSDLEGFSYLVRKDFESHTLSDEQGFDGRTEPALDVAPKLFGLMPRGAHIENSSPLYAFELSEKEFLWAKNVTRLYEEAKQNQWSADTDIDWAAIPDLDPEIETAICQVMTYLAENEFSALYIPGKFLSKISPYYMELVMFLGTIIYDEARHIEAFSRRANAKKIGLQYSTTATQRSLYSLFIEKDYFKTSFLLHVLGEGTFLDLLDFLIKYAPDPVTKKIVTLAKKDEQRHVNYGLVHVKALVQANPKRIAYLKEAVDSRKVYLDEMNQENELLLSSLAILAGGSDEDGYALGYERVEQLKKRMGENRVRRMIECGFDEETAKEISMSHTANFM
ncbi:MAG: ferritin-like domain-containing protein [Sulfuricurvum sp.]|uniref:ferritin-like domain-containing protein n=1 Tax=Sulfuricurvum sp. TaxID=2025608 RepID=UPI0025CF2869|nr:ferritin-like domain-containing protein [Sulfuricurvum sp.]MBV5320669.1 ferritin-like domain-containing protein [Sulfuricurvum sp.]